MKCSECYHGSSNISNIRRREQHKDECERGQWGRCEDEWEHGQCEEW